MPPRPYQDKRSGKWRGQVPLPNGRRLSKSFATKREANAWIVRTLHSIEQGTDPTPQKITVAQFLDRWLADVVRMKCRPKTIESYEYVVCIHLAPALGHMQLAGLRGDHIQHVCATVLEAGRSRRTAEYIHAVAHRALAWAVRWRLIAHNPADDAVPPKPTRREMQTLTADQARALLAATAGHNYHVIYLLAIVTGMRQGEILGLHWADVDLARGVLHVTTAAQTLRGRGVVMAEPKTQRSRRPVPLTVDLVAALRAHHRTQLLLRLRTPGWEDHDLVFCSSAGRPVLARNLMRHFYAVRDRLGLPRLRFHDLRHTAATLMLREAVNPRVVQAILGHEDISQTLDTYSEYSLDMGTDAVERVQGLLGRQ